jgi:D-inositol-3-phosphate glycosyltransferase
MAPDVACHVARMPVAAELFRAPAPGSPRSGALFVGRLTAQKGVDVLLRAFAGIPGAAPLTIVGSGPEESALRRLAAELGLAERVRWVPTQPQAELAGYYRGARVLAVPSTEEGLGLVAVEAALCGTPAVGFASGGLPDVIADRVTGRLVHAGHVAAFGQAVDMLLSDGDTAAAFGAAAAARAAEFTPARAAARYLDVYAAALASKQASSR